MTPAKKILIAIILVGTLVLAAYLFFWLMILAAVVAPIGYLWWRWKVRQLKKKVRRRSEAMTIEPTHHLTE